MRNNGFLLNEMVKVTGEKAYFFAPRMKKKKKKWISGVRLHPTSLLKSIGITGEIKKGIRPLPLQHFYVTILKDKVRMQKIEPLMMEERVTERLLSFAM